MTTLDADPEELLDHGQAVADVPEGDAFAAWKLRVLSPEEFGALSDGPGRLSRTQLLYLSWFNLLAPTTHFVSLAQAILYRGAGFSIVWPQFLAIAGIGAAFFGAALWRFRRTIGQMA